MYTPSSFMETDKDKNVVPTWNYVAVHVYGRLHIMSDCGALLQKLRDTVEKYEGAAAVRWSIDDSDEPFLAGLLDSIVGFEIEISRLEGKWKLSQNHTPQRRLRVIDALTHTVGERQHQIAELMSQILRE